MGKQKRTMNMITYSERFKQEEKGERGDNRNDHK